ncbi:MAG: lytic transglycosylase domain-containing protein [Magnetococcales bacterium]|nr:lytic transglycosylase domain-containing protein [Magnetococcales bacterium]MBF0309260.1 lytic transglycosylase domain-containing protein [Magnetococcales bacterium]
MKCRFVDAAKRLLLLGFLLICGGAGTAWADIFSYVDAKGVIHITNQPRDSRYRLLMQVNKKPVKAPAVRLPEISPSSLQRDGGRYGEVIRLASQHFGLDSALVKAVIHAESAFNANAVSPKGALGLMQLMPDTAKRYGVNDAMDPVVNIVTGSRHLRGLMARFDNDLVLSLAAYNAGENAVEKYGNRVPPYPETRQYVSRVLQYYRHYRESRS